MFYPLFDRVVVRQEQAAELTKGGIIIPEAGKERPLTGVILALGETCASLIAVGDRVQFNKFGGVKVKMSEYTDNGTEEELTILKEPEIIGYFKKG